MKKKQVVVNKKIGGNDCRAFLHSKLLNNDFVFFEECCSMNEGSAIKKL
jgi:hypothetical protein